MSEPLVFLYRNYRGETATRRVEPRRVHHGSTEQHPEPQWLLTAFCLDRQAERDFALKDVLAWGDASADLASRLLAAVREHHGQKADDRCVEDDDRLYEAADLPPCDRRVGSKEEMLRNCERFIDRRCEGGGPWRSYADLEQDNERLRVLLTQISQAACGRGDAPEALRAIQTLLKGAE